jgi:hypothetical protein
LVDLLNVERRAKRAADIADDSELNGAAVDFLTQGSAVEEDDHQACGLAQEVVEGRLGRGVEQGQQGGRMSAVETLFARQGRDQQAALGQQPDSTADHLGCRSLQLVQPRRAAEGQQRFQPGLGVQPAHLRGPARRLVEPDVVALGLCVGHGHQSAGAGVARQMIGEGGANEVDVEYVAQVGQDIAPQVLPLGGQVF